MARWEPGAGDRLREAALSLYLERGFEQTMVADIAGRAGVTARTFFRHFADKREVLFDGASELEKKSLAALDAVPAPTPALDAVAAVLDTVAQVAGGDRELARKRQAVIMANADLRERELIKLTSLSTALAERLRRRGVGDIEASLAAETGIVVFRVAFSRWVTAAEVRDLRDIIRETLSRLRNLAGR
ncbi:TetR family transcriptional regulator [Myceligenerans pegani]|uniref:TetR family transcriptional regulator n=1 Tax=Myceligenerans pegani TaxID=2776917 RepID=A0ABR9N5T5_9MICO|nr:TetR family transcriptional regulator [Myceligenerans sp. TRM 65318]MBE1879019.1 TetR family transcriptional regulator [Myceligenerans sp. TRM 65318]MBE3021290.1 TetR family transcriptional regulator [Myceligenerans sp. TRM 65318]